MAMVWGWAAKLTQEKTVGSARAGAGPFSLPLAFSERVSGLLVPRLDQFL